MYNKVSFRDVHSVFIDLCTLTWEALCFNCGVFMMRFNMYEPGIPPPPKDIQHPGFQC